MKKSQFGLYYCLSVICVLIISAYPIYMGAHVAADMLASGSVLAENYPKYIIPYTPISLAVIFGVAVMPILLRTAKRFALPAGCGAAVGVFFLCELLLEKMVIVTETVETTLENWQMYMCYIPPASYETRTWTAVDVLIGEYNPAFKIHFYIISIVIILALLNSFYGFGAMIKSGNKKRKKPLIIQSVCSLAFIGMCIWACFTAFYRTGEITVSALSAALMALFFILFGVTAGIFVGSLLPANKKALSVVLPSVIAALMTIIMYIGEMILLSGHLYRFGEGFFFDGIVGIVLAPADIAIIFASGLITFVIMKLISRTSPENQPKQ